MADYIPHNTVTVHVKENPWVKCELKRLIPSRNVLLKRYKRTKQSTHYNSVEAIQNHVASLNRSLRKTYYQNLCEELCSSQISERQWWKTVKKVTSVSVERSIPVLIEQDLPVSDIVQKANIFNIHTLQISVHYLIMLKIIICLTLIAKIDGSFSDYQPAKADGSQGSILGALLFLVQINDIARILCLTFTSLLMTLY